jgi:ApbE superfamily uncharacterized protein (UPF0280 family)
VRQHRAVCASKAAAGIFEHLSFSFENVDTVAILAQGTSLALASQQAFLS